jgi:hypothetical protein
LVVVNTCNRLKTGTIFLILAQKLKPSMPANIKSIELRNLQIEDYKQLKFHD